MSEQEKKTTKNLSFPSRWNQAKVSLSIVYKARKIFTRKVFFKKMGERRIEQKRKNKKIRRLFNSLRNGD